MDTVITPEEAYKIGYDMLLSLRIRDLNFREKTDEKKMKTDIGRLSKELGIPREKMLAFVRFALKDMNDRVAKKLEENIKMLYHISFK